MSCMNTPYNHPHQVDTGGTYTYIKINKIIIHIICLHTRTHTKEWIWIPSFDDCIHIRRRTTCRCLDFTARSCTTNILGEEAESDNNNTEGQTFPSSQAHLTLTVTLTHTLTLTLTLTPTLHPVSKPELGRGTHTIATVAHT